MDLIVPGKREEKYALYPTDHLTPVCESNNISTIRLDKIGELSGI
jgi:hypothetical protein